MYVKKMDNINPNKQIIPHSFHIDFTNTGWEKINIDKMLTKLHKAASIQEKVRGYAKLKGGCFNLLLKVKTNLTTAVVKISPLWNKGNIRREIFARSCLKEQPCKTFKLALKILYLPEENAILNGHEILVTEYIRGKKPTKHELESVKFHKKLAGFLNQIHTQKMDGYGWLDNKCKGRNKTWQDFLLNVDNLDIVMTKKLISKRDINWLFEQLITKYDYSFTPVLLYGDLKPENILIKDGKIYIIDFENCFSGHKLYDIGITLFFIPQVWKYRGFYTGNITQKKTEKLIILYAMRHSLSCLGHRVSVNDKKGAKIAIKRFFELKQIYESTNSE